MTLFLSFAKQRRETDSERRAWDLSLTSLKKGKKQNKKTQQTLAHVMYLSSPTAVTLIAM